MQSKYRGLSLVHCGFRYGQCRCAEERINTGRLVSDGTRSIIQAAANCTLSSSHARAQPSTYQAAGGWLGEAPLRRRRGTIHPFTGGQHNTHTGAQSMTTAPHTQMWQAQVQPRSARPPPSRTHGVHCRVMRPAGSLRHDYRAGILMGRAEAKKQATTCMAGCSP